MELQGKIIAVLDKQSGTSAKGEWSKQQFVIEEAKDSYPQKITAEVWNDKVVLSLGDKATFHFNCDCREYQGKWYNQIKIWKVENHEKHEKATTNLDNDLPW